MFLGKLIPGAFGSARNAASVINAPAIAAMKRWPLRISTMVRLDLTALYAETAFPAVLKVICIIVFQD
jgi:hypothetical protein